jgi:hypothetical protein
MCVDIQTLPAIRCGAEQLPNEAPPLSDEQRERITELLRQGDADEP